MDCWLVCMGEPLLRHFVQVKVLGVALRSMFGTFEEYKAFAELCTKNTVSKYFPIVRMK